MVRLVITDFVNKEENEAFYLSDEFDTSQQMFTYHAFKKNTVFLSKYDINDEIYSLNLLSRRNLLKNQFLIYIDNGEYIILFNHKTVYSAKINENFITDDMIKSVLITKHIAMLSSGGDIDRIYFIINSRFKAATENILKQNTRNEKNEVIAQSLGEVEELIKPLTELDTYKTFLLKNLYILTFIGTIIWILFTGLPILEKKFLDQESLTKIKRELKVEKRLAIRQKILLKKSEDKYTKLIQCITPEIKND